MKNLNKFRAMKFSASYITLFIYYLNIKFIIKYIIIFILLLLIVTNLLFTINIITIIK